MRYQVGLTGCVILLLSFTAAAQEGQEEARSPITPFLNDQVVGVIRADLSKIDTEELLTWIEERVEQLDLKEEEKAQLLRHLHGGVIPPLRQEHAQLTAGGAQEVYWVLPQDVGPLVVIPVPEGKTAREIEALFGGQMQGPVSGRVGTVMENAVIRSQGEQPILWLEEEFEVSPRPDLLEALSAAGDAELIVAVALSEPARQAMHGARGGGPLIPLIEKTRWAALSVQGPPEHAVRLVVQATNPADAQAVADLLEAQLEQIKRQPEAAGMQGAMDRLRPKVENDRVVVTADQQTLDALAAGSAPAIREARERANIVASQSNLRQLAMAVLMHASENQAKMPDTLAQLWPIMGAQAGGVSPAARNPRNPEKEIGYVYLKPPVEKLTDIKNSAEQMMLFEAWDELPEEIAVGFVDGHSEVRPRENFEQFLKQMKDAGWVEVRE